MTFNVLVNGNIGNVDVNLNEDVILTIMGASPNNDVIIVDQNTFPDTVLCSGTSDNVGTYTCTVRFIQEGVFGIRGGQDCILGICSDYTDNIVTVVAGGNGNGGGYQLTVNGQSGEIRVADGSTLNLRVSGVTAGDAIEIYIDERLGADTKICNGIANASGEFTCQVTAGTNVIWVIYALNTTPLPDVESNRVRVTIGEGAIQWGTYILIGAAIVAAALIISQFYKSKR